MSNDVFGCICSDNKTLHKEVQEASAVCEDKDLTGVQKKTTTEWGCRLNRYRFIVKIFLCRGA